MNGRGEKVTSSAPTEDSSEEEGSPPSQIKDTERKEIFAMRQKLSEEKHRAMIDISVMGIYGSYL